ncbi:MAG: DUF4430 domain-containing protein [Eubacteriales bacterium]|nr:DUF4430 domain-containing protein [Eubacteriales bacterium]
MKNLSRILAVVMAAAALLVFTGCQKAPANTQTAQPTAQATAEPTAAPTDAPQTGKSVTIKIVAANQNIDTSFTYTTEAEMLADVLTEHAQELGVTIEDGQYGAYITTAGGYTANDGSNEFWSILVNGEVGMNGASTQPVADGDVFTLELSTY